MGQISLNHSKNSPSIVEIDLQKVNTIFIAIIYFFLQLSLFKFLCLDITEDWSNPNIEDDVDDEEIERKCCL